MASFDSGDGDTDSRPMTPAEDALLRAFLSFDFPGVEELRVQARSVLVTGRCGCGCGTVDLRPVGDARPRSVAASPVEITGDVLDPDGDTAGGVLLFVHDGLLSLLEVYTYTEAPLAIPSLGLIRWSR